MKLPHFDTLFTPSEYYAGYTEQPENIKTLLEGTPAVRLKRLMEELRKNVLWDLNPYVETNKNDQRSSIKRARLEEAEKLVNAILDLKKGELSNMKWDEDLSWMSLYTGSNRDIDNAYVNIYSKLLDEANNKANGRYTLIEQLYKAYLNPMVEDYFSNHGKTKVPILAGQQDRAGFWTNIDPTKFWEACFKRDDEGHIIGINATDQDWADAAKRFPYLNKGNTMRNHRNMMEFQKDNYAQFFVNEKAPYTNAEGRKVAMANRPATWRTEEGKEKVVSDLELHLNPQPALGGRKKEWSYNPTFFAKVPITEDELGWLAQVSVVRNFDKNYRKHIRQSFTVNAVESELLQERNLDEALPLIF